MSCDGGRKLSLRRCPAADGYLRGSMVRPTTGCRQYVRPDRSPRTSVIPRRLALAQAARVGCRTVMHSAPPEPDHRRSARRPNRSMAGLSSHQPGDHRNGGVLPGNHGAPSVCPAKNRNATVAPTRSRTKGFIVVCVAERFHMSGGRRPAKLTGGRPLVHAQAVFARPHAASEPCPGCLRGQPLAREAPGEIRSAGRTRRPRSGGRPCRARRMRQTLPRSEAKKLWTLADWLVACNSARSAG